MSTLLGPENRGGEQVSSTQLDDTHRFQALIKEYELATNRLDKTDDRIIQLVGIGLAALGAVFLFLSRLQSSELIPGTVAEGRAPTQATLEPSLWQNAVFCLVTFTCIYALLSLSFVLFYWGKGMGRPFPSGLMTFFSEREGALAKRKRRRAPRHLGSQHSLRRLRNPWSLSNSGSPLSPNFVGLFSSPSERLSKAIQGLGGEVRRNRRRKLADELEHLTNYEAEDKKSFRKMRFAYAFPLVFGIVAISIVELGIAPDIRGQENLPAVELLWLLTLLFVGFNSLIIYVMYSSFGHLWLCRVLSHRLNTLLQRKLLVRFDRALMPSLFFSYSTGNWKPRLPYWLLLASVGALFCSVVFISFAQIYVNYWFEGSLYLAFYLFIVFLQLFALSGVRHDLHNRHEKFIEEQEEYMSKEWGTHPPF